jgi:hypothetical protein
VAPGALAAGHERTRVAGEPEVGEDASSVTPHCWTSQQWHQRAIREIEGAEAGVRVVRVESDDANTIAKINAELLGVGGA